MKKNKGFTLIELLVVIAIIGILSSVVMAGIGNSKAKSRDAIRAGDVKTLSQAVELYFTEHGYVFPDNLDEPEMKDYFVDGVIPTDPKTGEEYPYASNNDSPKHYCIGAVMEVIRGNNVSCDEDLNLGHDVTYIIKGP